MWDIFVGFFSNIFNIVMIVLFVLVGVIVGLLWKPKAQNEVMKLLPRDRRFIDFKVAHEDAFSVTCEKIRGFPPQRFIKLRPGYTGKIGKFLKRSITRFIGKEGTAYTWQTEEGEPTKIKKNPKGFIELSNALYLGSLADALRKTWGEKIYDQLKGKMRKELEESKINVTLDLEEGLTPKDFKPVSEEDIKTEEDRKAAKTWWEGKKAAEKGKWTEWIFIFAAGMGAAFFLIKVLGWMA